MTGNCPCRPGTGGANLRAYAVRRSVSQGAGRSISTFRNTSEAPGTCVTAGPVPTGKVTLTMEFRCDGNGSAPIERASSQRLTVWMSVPSTGAEGVLVTSGSLSGGYPLYIKDQKVVMDNVSAVSEEYRSPFSFKGRIEQAKIELK